MIKILTILTLLYFITLSALPNVETNNGIESVEAKTKKSNQKADELNSYEQDRNLCSRRKDSNEVDLDVGYEPPVSEETQLNAFDNNPESESQIQSVNKNQEGKLHRGSGNEVYYKDNPDHKHVTFDEQMKQLFYKNQEDVNKNSSGFKNEKEAPSNNRPSNEQEQELFKYSDEVNSPNDTAVDEGESSDSQFKSSSDNQDQKQTNDKPTDSTKSNQVEGDNKSSKEELDNKEPLSEKNGPNKGGSKMDQNCTLFPESTRRANYEGPEVVQMNDNSDPNKPVLPAKQARKNNQRYNSKFPPVDTQLTDPASVGVVPMSPAAGLSLLEHYRVCYACTSASNPTCVQPDRRTTVKYCLKGHESCVTKTYQTGKDKDSLVLIRDCGTSCDDTEVPGYRYKSCKVCHTDICNDEPFNGAFSIRSQSFIITLLGILLIKYTI